MIAKNNFGQGTTTRLTISNGGWYASTFDHCAEEGIEADLAHYRRVKKAEPASIPSSTQWLKVEALYPPCSMVTLTTTNTRALPLSLHG